jgi:hypothetical protein
VSCSAAAGEEAGVNALLAESFGLALGYDGLMAQEEDLDVLGADARAAAGLA